MKRYTFKKIFGEILKHKSTLIKANIISIIAVIVSVGVPLLIPTLVDEILLNKPGNFLKYSDYVFGKGHSNQFYIFLALFLAVFLRGVYFLLSIWQNWYYNNISKEVSYKIRKDLLSHISKLSLSEYENFGSGKISSLLIVDIATVDKFLSSSISQFLISFLTVLGVGVILVIINWQLALFILVVNPLIVVVTSRFAKKVRAFKKSENAKKSSFQDSLNEVLELFWQVKASNKERSFFKSLTTGAKKIKNSSIAYEYKSDVAQKKSYLFLTTGFEMMRTFGLFMVLYSDLSIGLMLAVFGYLWVILSPIQNIINIQYDYHNAKVALDRINKIFDLKTEPQFEHIKNPFKNSLTNSIKVENLYFSYSNGIDILKDINLEIQKGSKVAIVGASGSGKSTLSQIIAGFYFQRSGDIYYDGIKSKEIGLDVIRDNVFIVLQTPLMFNETVRFNLCFDKKISDQEIIEALKIAQLDDFILSLEHGIDEMVGKNGIKLSGGQRQRLSIARMILAKPNIVILDESTSSLDVLTEEILFKRLELFLKERTTIIVAHRLSTLNIADKIYVLEDGKIVESGMKDELIALGGYFSRYYNKGRG